MNAVVETPVVPAPFVATSRAVTSAAAHRASRATRESRASTTTRADEPVAAEMRYVKTSPADTVAFAHQDLKATPTSSVPVRFLTKARVGVTTLISDL